MKMQNQAKKKKKKRELVFKPYLKGFWHGRDAVKKGLKILLYYLLFLFLFLVVGLVLNSQTPWLAWIANLAMISACGMLLYTEGARQGEAQVALGEIAYARQETGKDVSPEEKDKCFHPLKGWFSMLVGVLLPLLVCGAYALMARKQVYQLQALPEWVTSFEKGGEVLLPLSYYQNLTGLEIADYLRVVVRLLILPFSHLGQLYGADGLLTVDRLSPLLVCLPALGYPLGYLTGPRSRALVHGDIRSNEKRNQRRRNRAIKASRRRTEKKNELI